MPRSMQGNPRQSWILNSKPMVSGFQALESGYLVSDFWYVDNLYQNIVRAHVPWFFLNFRFQTQFLWYEGLSLGLILVVKGGLKTNRYFSVFLVLGGIIGFTLRKDVYNETVEHAVFKETTKFGYREKMDEIENEKRWKLLRCDLIDYHTTMDELRAKCYSLMYQVLWWWTFHSGQSEHSRNFVII